MDYEKAKERIKSRFDKWALDDKDIEALQAIIPELRESEDERIRKCIRLCLDECVHSDIIRDYERDECLTYLEKQKDEVQKQFNLGVQAGREEAMYEMEKEQKSAEWSEEDKKMLSFLDSILEYAYDNNPRGFSVCCIDAKNWLNSLRPQPHWKPSKEQMDALKLIVSNKKRYAPVLHEIALDTLYNDLKKL